MTEIPNTLFSESKIKELSAKQEVKPKQKKAIQKWKDDLDSGKLDVESHYKDHLRDLMMDGLGYPRDKIMSEKGKNATHMDYSYTPISGNNGVLFELKSRKKNLFKFQGYDKSEQETPVDQALDYISHNPSISYAIVTNFEKFVLLTRAQMKDQCYKFTFPPKGSKLFDSEIQQFYHFFSKDGIESGFVEEAKRETIREEKKITDDFYTLYHQTRLMLIHAFEKKSNIEYNNAIEITQTYLNRLVFLFFAEDNNLIKKRIFTDGILSLLNSGTVKEKTTQISDYIQTLFTWMNSGSNEIDNHYGFNGEFFKEPIDRNAFFYDFQTEEFFKEIFKKVTVPNNIILNEEDQIAIDGYEGKISPIIINLLKMASFNFKDKDPDKILEDDDDYSNEQITVNILGHIFEQSIGDLEDLQNREESKRKNEGVFYTPEYITKYICKNTIIPYLSKNGVTEPHQLVMEFKDNIKELEDKIDKMKILDPACGSGAFLVKAVDVVISIFNEIQNFKEQQGNYIISKKTKFESGIVKQSTFDKEHEIDIARRKFIKSNIYGVDLNPESVEITKLSLFLKIASKNKQLISLSDTILEGNSIINDDTLDQKSFDWETKFAEILHPEIGEKFDIVIGNPPYVRQERLSDFKPYLSKNYTSYSGTADLYVYFLEKGLKNLKNDGYFGVIVSNKWSKATYGKNIRTILKNYKILEFIDFGDLPVFTDATTYPCILLIKKSSPTNNLIFVSKPDTLEKDNVHKMIQQKRYHIPQSSLTSEAWAFQNTNYKKINDKIKQSGIPLENYCKEKINRGLLTGLDNVFVINGERKIELEKESTSSSKLIKPYLIGKQIKRYFYDWDDTNILLIKKGEKIERFPAIQNYLKQFKKELEARWDKGDWFSLRTCAFYDDFSKPKIIFSHFAKRPQFTYDDKNYYINAKGYILPSNDKYLLGILNSSVISFFARSICPFVRGEYYEFNKQFVNQFPIPQTSEGNKLKIINNVEKILEKNEQKLSKDKAVQNVICADFSIKQIPSKLKNLDNLTPVNFLKVIKKLSKPGTTDKKLEKLVSYFSDYQSEISNIKNEILELDSEIDEIVFSIFNLSENEITTIFKELS